MNILDLIRADGQSQEALHQRAHQECAARFGRTVFVRGVVEVSSYCRQNCHYCAMRRDNRSLERYRLSKDQLLELIVQHRPASITDIDIQAGEDPVAVREVVIPLIRDLRHLTDLGITVCLGTLSNEDYDQLRDAGADYYILKLETGDAAHYRDILAPGSLQKRLDSVHYLAASGWNVSSGFIVGLPGQTEQMIARTLGLLCTLPLAGASVSPFIAGNDTPFAAETDGSVDLTLNCLALMRLMSPRWIIPAVSAMKLVARDGYARALNAGANLTTINLTPRQQRANYPIYKRDRMIMDEECVLSAIAQAGCAPSQVSMSEFLRKQATVAV